MNKHFLIIIVLFISLLFSRFSMSSDFIDRFLVSKAVVWKSNKFIYDINKIEGKILAINDFHGQIVEGKRVGGRPVGGAAVLTSYLKTSEEQYKNRTFYVDVGDLIGGSPPESALLQDEPTIMFFNMLGNTWCSYKYKYDFLCNVIGIPGNHEFDEGVDELLRIINGGNYKNGPFLEDPYRGINFAFISSNIIYTNGKHFLKPYSIKMIDGVPIAFIGATLKETPTMVTPSLISGLNFLDEVECINKYVKELQNKKIKAIVVVIHQGGEQNEKGELNGPISLITKYLDNEVDIVLSAHSHTYINTIVKNNNGKSILVTQAFSSGTAYADINFVISKTNGDIIEKKGKIVTTYADEGPGLNPDKNVDKLVKEAVDKVKPIIAREITIIKNDITREQNDAGESALGDLIADAQKWQMKVDFAFMNPGGIRDDLKAGSVTYGDLYSVQPFGNSLIKMGLTGSQIKALLNQQWRVDDYTRMLQISGLSYIWDSNRKIGDRIVNIIDEYNNPIDDNKFYSVVANSFLADGGDGFSVLKDGKNKETGPTDLEALVNYLLELPKPIFYSIEGRIKKL
jgi:5'-nucleotidase